MYERESTYAYVDFNFFVQKKYQNNIVCIVYKLWTQIWKKEQADSV